MAKSWKLIKTMVRMQLSLAGKTGGEKAWIGFGIIVAIPFICFILSILHDMVSFMYNTLSTIGQEYLLLALVFLFMFFVYFITSIGTILSSFYFAEDVDSFLPLPFHPYQIMLGKSAIPFLSLYGINTLFLLPILVFYGMASNAGSIYYMYTIVLWAMTPLLPFVLAAILLMFLMRFANISKQKDRTKMILGLSGFVFAIGINVLVRLDSGGDSQQLTEWVLNKDALLQEITKFFPSAYYSTLALTETSLLSGFWNLVIVILIGILSFALFLTVGQNMYFKGVRGLSSGKRGQFQEPSKRRFQEKSILRTLLAKELRLIFRTPTFFLQIFVQTLFFPVFVFIIFLMDFGPSGTGDILNGMEDQHLFLALFGVSILALGANPASFSSISREGKGWFNHLYLPVTSRDVIMSKLLISFFLNMLSIVILGVLAIWIMHLSVFPVLLWVMVSLISSWLASAGGLIFDFHYPHLHWTDEREVFKGRTVGLLVLVTEAAVFGIALLVLWNVDYFDSIWKSAGTLTAYLLLLTAGCQYYLWKVADRTFYRLAK